MQDTNDLNFGDGGHHVLSYSSRPASMDRRLKPPTDSVLKCPRCDSYNTKFCYYNNYSLSQPRHFCKNCRRYWTKGGALRNVPVGGGCRKNKRTKQRICTQEQSTNPDQPIASSISGDNSSSLSLPEAPCSAFYSVTDIEGKNITLNPLPRDRIQPLLRLSDQVAVNSFSNHGHFGAPAQSSLTSLSQLSNLASLHSGLMGLDFNAAIRREHGNVGGAGNLGAMFTAPHQDNLTSEACASIKRSFNFASEGSNGVNHDAPWKSQLHKLDFRKDEEPIREGQVLMPAFTSDHSDKLNGTRNLSYRHALPNISQCIKVEESGKQANDWNYGQGLFDGMGEQNYWSIHGAWSDFSPSYAPSTSPFL